MVGILLMLLSLMRKLSKCIQFYVHIFLYFLKLLLEIFALVAGSSQSFLDFFFFFFCGISPQYFLKELDILFLLRATVRVVSLSSALTYRTGIQQECCEVLLGFSDIRQPGRSKQAVLRPGNLDVFV